MVNFERIFPAKVLLFGEYTVLHGGEALAIPFPKFFAKWIKTSEIDHRLIDFLAYLKDCISLEPYICRDKIASLDTALQDGLILQSTIPMGYGLGSSASVCAAVLSAIQKEDIISDEDLRFIFSEMEAYYHGTSSGIDPFVPFYQKAIKIQEEKISFCVLPTSMPNVYLFDSLIPRKGKQLINWYNSRRVEGSDFYRSCEQLKSINQSIISSEDRDIIKDLKELTSLQLQSLAHFIPEKIRALWKISLDQNLAYFKLCGAGGGGMFLVLSPNRIEDYPEYGGYSLYKL